MYRHVCPAILQWGNNLCDILFASTDEKPFLDWLYAEILIC